jgi:cyanoexosortase A
VALAAALSAIYLALIWRSGDQPHLAMSLLFGVAAGNSLWEKRRFLLLGSSLGAMAIGVLCLVSGVAVAGLANWLADQSFTYPTASPGFRLLPLFWALGVFILASGFRLKQYWQEFAILAALALPSVLAGFLPDISPLTAKVSALMLWYTGFDVSLEGVYVSLSNQSVQIYSGCSGIESTTYLFGMSIVCLLSFPIQGTKRYFIPAIAAIMGFFVNLIRVALMVILNSTGNKAAFNYWHTGQGSLVFGAIAIFLFGAFYFFLMQIEEKKNADEHG